MHSCAIIVKMKDMLPEEARELAGDELVSLRESDWYGYDKYNDSRVFSDGNVESNIPDFLNDEQFKDLIVPFLVVNHDDNDDTEAYVDFTIIPSQFYEYELVPEIREDMISLQREAYIKTTRILLESLGDNYDMCLLDYHH